MTRTCDQLNPGEVETFDLAVFALVIHAKIAHRVHVIGTHKLSNYFLCDVPTDVLPIVRGVLLLRPMQLLENPEASLRIVAIASWIVRNVQDKRTLLDL